MFFSLTALGPASLGLPPARAATARSAATGRPRARAASPRSWAGRAGGRPAGQAAAMPGTALLCGRVLRPPPFRLPQACSGQAAPPAARRSATLRPPGVPSPSGPWPLGLGSCWRPGCPATSSAPPLLAPPGCPRSAASLARCQAAWEPGPGWGTFLRGCVWGGVRDAVMPGEGEAQMPGGRPPAPGRPAGPPPPPVS